MKRLKSDRGVVTRDSARSPAIFRGAFDNGGLFSALGGRDYRLLWSGAFVSNVGTWIHTTALLWYIKSLTGSNTWVGAVNLASFLPVLLFVIYAGSLADRFNRKRLIIANQTVLLVAAFTLALLTSLGVSSKAVIMIITFAMGTAFALNFPAWQAILPDLVSGEELLNGIALNSAQFNLARFVGPGIGAIVLNYWGVAPAFYLNSVSFLAVIWALTLMKTKTPAYPPSDYGTGRHIAEGVKYIRTNRWAFNVLLILGIFSFFGLPYIVLMPALGQDVFHKGVWGYGFLLVLSGLGAVIGAPLVTYLNRYLKEREILKISIAALGLFLVAIALSRTYWLSLVFSAGLGCSFLMASTSINTVLQSRVKRDIRGRIMSFYVLMLIGIFPIGGLAMGAIADARSAPFALLLGGCACITLAVILIAIPALTREAVSPESAVT